MMQDSLLAEECVGPELAALAVARCPICKQALRSLSPGEIEAINHRIATGELTHHDGSPVKEPLAGAVQAADAPFVYRVEDGILIALPALAIVLDGSTPPQEMSGDKHLVKFFYDQLGWTKKDGDNFVDAEKWEDLRPVSRDYIERCHRRVKRHLPERGKYLLDAASGPVQYDSYLEYSTGYQARICIDLSLRALQEAKRKLGNRGIYILGDITNLPLQDGAIDAAVSLHTIYHVPADEQASAFRELHRVLRPEGSAVVVYSWPSRLAKLSMLPAQLARAPFRLIRKLTADGKRSKRDASNGSVERPQRAEPRLYFHSHKHAWFVRQSWPFKYEIHSWRSVSVKQMRAYVHPRGLGRTMLRGLFALEERFPSFFGRFGMYPLIVVRKR